MKIIVKDFEVSQIEFNFNELKNKTQEFLEKYQNLVFTDETMQEGKKTRAELNHLKKEFDDKRKEIKKIINEPYAQFENKIKELIALIDAPILAIDTQIKSFENKKKQEKEEEIKSIYKQHIGDMEKSLPIGYYEKIFDSRWLNATATTKSISMEILQVIEKTKNDLKTIDDLNSEFFVEIKNCYFHTLDLSKALQLKTELEKQKKFLEEREKEQNTKIIEKKEDIKIEEKKDVSKKLCSFTLKIQTTIEKKDSLKKFLTDNNIEYEVL